MAIVNRVQMRAHQNDWMMGVNLMVRTYDPVTHRLEIVKSVEMEEVDNNPVYHEPAFFMTTEEAQALMDSLWACGLRPTEGAGSAGALAATQKHLADMQKIAFDLLERPK